MYGMSRPSAFDKEFRTVVRCNVKAFPDGIETGGCAGGGLDRIAVDRVRDFKRKRSSLSARPYDNRPSIQNRGDTVFDGILNKWLKDEGRHATICRFGV